MPPSTPSPPLAADDDRVRIVEGDAAQILAGIEPRSVDAVLCDPPHGVLQASWDILPAIKTWQAVLGVMRPGARLLVICSSRTYHRLATHVEDAGFEIEGMAVWCFATGRPPSTARLKPAFAPILIARKPGPALPINLDDTRIPFVDAADAKQTHRIDTLRAAGTRRTGVYDPSLSTNDREHAPFAPKKGRYPSDLILTESVLGHYNRFFLIPKTRAPNGHPAAKPVELLAHILNLYTDKDAEVLDPFAGGGSTGVAALLTGRRALLIERNPEFVKLARQNLGSARQGDFGLPARVNPAHFLADVPDVPANAKTCTNEALRYPTERATVDLPERLDTMNEMAARLGISTRTLRRRVCDGSILAIPLGRGARCRAVRFDPGASLDRLRKREGANDVCLPRQKDEHLGSAGPADRSGQAEAAKMSARPRNQNRRARHREEDDRGAGSRGSSNPQNAGAPAAEEARGDHLGTESECCDSVTKLRAAAVTARLLLKSRRAPSSGNL